MSFNAERGREMKNLENFLKQVKICERAEEKFGKDYINKQYGERFSRMMDFDSADQIFNLRFDDFLASDDENFYHDVFGIWSNSNRETYPCTFGMFVPRFSGR